MTGLQATGNGPGGYGPGGGAPPGGGYGPPPGGGGGGYGPPQGGPPGGGGSGGPPQGGPPGGGGYGGPPQGGPPGGGGFGGPPPGGYGGPPMPPSPPQKPGSNVGMIVGIGCVALLVLGGIAAAFVLFYVRKAATVAITPPASTRPLSPPASPGLGAGVGTGALKIELHDLRDFTGSFGKSRYFVGELQNTGDAAVGYPSAKVTLLDAGNTAIDSGVCASVIRLLPPGEKVPCTFSSSKADGYATSRTEVTPMRSYLKGSPANLKVEGIKFTPKKGYSPNQLEGKITNLSSFKAKSVWALVSLYGTDGKIVGAEQTMVAGSDLDAGGSALFSAKVYNVAAQPQTYTVKAIGYGE